VIEYRHVITCSNGIESPLKRLSAESSSQEVELQMVKCGSSTLSSNLSFFSLEPRTAITG